VTLCVQPPSRATAAPADSIQPVRRWVRGCAGRGVTRLILAHPAPLAHHRRRAGSYPACRSAFAWIASRTYCARPGSWSS
jgi:hypothetical protein